MTDDAVARAKRTVIDAIRQGKWPSTEGVTEAMVSSLDDADALALEHDLERKQKENDSAS